MPAYDIYWDSLGEEQVLWHFDEEIVNDDEDCELWRFSLLDEDAA